MPNASAPYAPPPAHPFIIYIFKQHAPPSATNGRWNATTTRLKDPLSGSKLIRPSAARCQPTLSQKLLSFTPRYSLLIKDSLSLCMGNGTSSLFQNSPITFNPLRLPKNHVTTRSVRTAKDSTTNYYNCGSLPHHTMCCKRRWQHHKARHTARG